MAFATSPRGIEPQRTTVVNHDSSELRHPDVRNLSANFSKALSTLESEKELTNTDRTILRMARVAISEYSGEVPELLHAFLAKYKRESKVDFNKLTAQEILRFGVMVMYSRAFNEADQTVEWLLDKRATGDLHDVFPNPKDVMKGALHYPLGMYSPYNSDREEKLTVGDLLYVVIPKIEEIVGFKRIPERREAVDNIVAYQIYGMQLVERLAKEGKPYSIQEARNYVQGTIGTYANLLADVIFDNDGQKKEFTSGIMKKKRNDDKVDFMKDAFSQPNPFFAEAMDSGTTPIFCLIARHAYKAYLSVLDAAKLVSPSVIAKSRDKFLEQVGIAYLKYFPEAESRFQQIAQYAY